MRLEDIHETDIERFEAGLVNNGGCIVYAASGSGRIAVRVYDGDKWTWTTILVTKLYYLVRGLGEQSKYNTCGTLWCCNPDHHSNSKKAPSDSLDTKSISKAQSKPLKNLANRPPAVHECVFTEEEKELFWRYMMKYDGSCWLPDRKTVTTEYGIISSARLSYALTHRYIPKGHQVRRMCDTPGCCNPTHLKLHPVYKKEKPTNR